VPKVSYTVAAMSNSAQQIPKPKSWSRKEKKKLDSMARRKEELKKLE